MLRFVRSIFAALVILGATVIQPATASTGTPLVERQGVLLPTLDPVWTSFPTKAGWNFPAAAAFAAPGIHARGTTNAGVPIPAGGVFYQVIRPPATPGGSGSCLSIVWATWRNGSDPIARGLGAWDHCTYGGWVWFRLASELSAAGNILVDPVLGETYVARVYRGAGAAWSAEVWNYGSSTWDTIVTNWSGGGPGTPAPTDTGTASFRYSFTTCQSGVRAFLRGVIVQGVPGGWMDAAQFRTLVPQTGCFPASWNHSEVLTAGGPNRTQANMPNP